jgi:hypothetical protein
MIMNIKYGFITALLTLIIISCLTPGAFAQDTRKEKAVKAYYNGFVDKSWDVIAAQLADGFTFTSPANDNDHIPLEKFKAECFPTSKYTKSVSFVKWFQSGDQLALLVQITTTDNKIVRNVDVYDFDSAGKIKAIEVFFGPGIGYPGSKK